MASGVQYILLVTCIFTFGYDAARVPLRDLTPRLTKKCKKFGICEDLPEYPQKLVDNLLYKYENAIEFHEDPKPPPAFRTNSDSENPCKTINTVIFPKAGQDKYGKWHLILNSKTKRVQGYGVELCNSTVSANLFQSDKKIECRQHYVERWTYVVQTSADSDLEATVNSTGILIPTCCKCMVHDTTTEHS